MEEEKSESGWFRLIIIVIFMSSVLAMSDNFIENTKTKTPMARCVLEYVDSEISWDHFLSVCKWKEDSRECFNYLQNSRLSTYQCSEKYPNTKIWKCIDNLMPYWNILHGIRQPNEGDFRNKSRWLEDWATIIDELNSDIRNCVILNK